MLNAVPAAINAASRQVTLRHPNSFSCVVSRKKVTRVETDANGDPSEMGGDPTMGGMGILRTEDEAEFEYEELGDAKLLFAAPFSQQDMIEHDNATLVERQREVLIECVKKPNEAGFFVADTSDLVCIEVGPGVIIAYEVASVSSPTALPPYERRLLLNPRDDLNYVEPFED